MAAVADALELLGLYMPFTFNQLRKQYYRCALRAHPDKGGDERMMQKIVAAKDLLANFVENPSSTAMDYRAEYYADPSPCPSATDKEEAIMHGYEFLQEFRDTPKDSPHRRSAMNLWHCIHNASHNPMLKDLLLFGAQCVWMLADNLSGDPSTQS